MILDHGSLGDTSQNEADRVNDHGRPRGYLESSDRECVVREHDHLDHDREVERDQELVGHEHHPGFGDRRETSADHHDERHDAQRHNVG